MGFDGDFYPNPPLLRMKSTELFDRTAKSLGLHPYPCAAAHASRPYTSPLGVQMGACTYCGFCSGYGCGNYPKSSSQTTIVPVVVERDGFELRTRSVVTRVLTDCLGRHATGVEYVDASGGTFMQPADMVFVWSFTLENSHLLLISGIGEPYEPATGKGTVGRNYAFQLWGASDFLLPGQTFDPWIGAGGLGQIIDDYDCDNFDHRAVPGKPFVGGGYIGLFQYGNQPIGSSSPGIGKDALWGAALKKKMADTYRGALQVQAMGGNQSYKDCYLSLDPTYTDPYGRPLLRVTYDIKDNDRLMSRFLVDQCQRIAEIGNCRMPTRWESNEGRRQRGGSPPGWGDACRREAAIGDLLDSHQGSTSLVLSSCRRASAYPYWPGWPAWRDGRPNGPTVCSPQWATARGQDWRPASGHSARADYVAKGGVQPPSAARYSHFLRHNVRTCEPDILIPNGRNKHSMGYYPSKRQRVTRRGGH